jgi:hypothetical protein
MRRGWKWGNRRYDGIHGATRRSGCLCTEPVIKMLLPKCCEYLVNLEKFESGNARVLDIYVRLRDTGVRHALKEGLASLGCDSKVVFFSSCGPYICLIDIIRLSVDNIESSSHSCFTYFSVFVRFPIDHCKTLGEEPLSIINKITVYRHALRRLLHPSSFQEHG